MMSRSVEILAKASTNPSRYRIHQHVPQEAYGQSGLSCFLNAVYYPSWRVYREQPPSSLGLGYISHVFYAFARLHSDGTIYLGDQYADTQIEVDSTQGCLSAFGALKHDYPHLKVVLSVGGGGDGSASFAGVACRIDARYTFARTARALVDSYGLDGIDIDWEHPSDPQQGVDFVSLLAVARAALPSPSYLLTAALPAGEWTMRHIDIYSASTYLDMINIMSYDFSGPWFNVSGHQAQLFSPSQAYNDAAAVSGDRAVTYLLSKGIPPRKLLLGIPVYGRSFLGASYIGQQSSGAGGEEGTFEYRDLPRPGTQEYVDEYVGAAFCIGGDGGFVTYDNPQTVKMKANYVKERRLGGLFYWTGTSDGVGSRSLVETGYNTLHDL